MASIMVGEVMHTFIHPSCIDGDIIYTYSSLGMEALATDKDIAWVFLNVSEAVAEVGGLGGHGSILSLLLPFYGRLRAQ